MSLWSEHPLPVVPPKIPVWSENVKIPEGELVQGHTPLLGPGERS